MAPTPLVFDITPLKRQPGHQLPFRLSLPAPEGVALETAEVVATDVHLDLLLEVNGDQLIAAGVVAVEWSGPCRRCLEPQTGRTDVDVREIFEKSPVEGETYRLDEDDVDLEPLVREAILLNLPVAPLCGDDCAGPDPERFPTTVVDDEPDEADAPIDPRWAALGELTFDD